MATVQLRGYRCTVAHMQECTNQTLHLKSAPVPPVLVGTYLGRTPSGSDHLWLHADGTCSHYEHCLHTDSYGD